MAYSQISVPGIVVLALSDLNPIDFNRNPATSYLRISPYENMNLGHKPHPMHTYLGLTPLN